MELTKEEMLIIKKALNDLSVAIYLHKATKKWNIPERQKDVDALYERVCDVYEKMTD